MLDELNARLRPHGLWFAPDVSPSNRATLGGMIGNNASGARSIVYGRTLEHVKEMTVVLPDGHILSARTLAADELARTLAATTREGDLYRTLHRLVGAHRNEILARYPKILRRVGGYALDEFVNGQPFSLARLLVGSEGTLATTLEAKINLEPRPTPSQVALMVVHFETMFEALESTTEILATGPTAIELADKYILDLTRRSLEYARQMTFVQGDPGALLFVEYYGETPGELAAQAGPAGGALPTAADRHGVHARPESRGTAKNLDGSQGRHGAPPRSPRGQEAHRVRRGHRGRSRESPGVHPALPSRSSTTTIPWDRSTPTRAPAVSTSARSSISNGTGGGDDDARSPSR